MSVPPFSTPDSVKERVLANLAAVLATIKVENGYSQDVKSVLRFRRGVFDLPDFPSLMVIGLRERKKRHIGAPPRTDVELDVEIQTIHAHAPVDESETAHNALIRDIETCVMRDTGRGTGPDGQRNAIDTEVVETEFDVVAVGQPHCVSTVTLLVKYRHSMYDPTQAY
jgi:hypothetical protein